MCEWNTHMSCDSNKRRVTGTFEVTCTGKGSVHLRLGMQLRRDGRVVQEIGSKAYGRVKGTLRVPISYDCPRYGSCGSSFPST
jgi:hypothetical protein